MLVKAHVWLQASPEFKGIKTPHPNNVLRLICFKPALNSKGLRPLERFCFVALFGFKPALNSKGLRRRSWLALLVYMLQASPEFKGIKTDNGYSWHRALLQASPEFKVIKTNKGS